MAASSRLVRLASSDGFSTHVLPAARAGATYRNESSRGQRGGSCGGNNTAKGGHAASATSRAKGKTMTKVGLEAADTAGRPGARLGAAMPTSGSGPAQEPLGSSQGLLAFHDDISRG